LAQNIEDLVKRAQNKDNSDDEWLQLEKDMLEFLKEDHPQSERKRLIPLGWLESVTIICDGIKRERGMR
jgi:hypothetical protein